MICSVCGNQWELQRAHIIVTKRAPEGSRELIQCPACGSRETVIRPDLDNCSDD